MPKQIGPDISEAAALLVLDSVTDLDVYPQGAVVVAGSHCGAISGQIALDRGARAVILNDAGVGLDSAGISALPYLEARGMAAVAVSHLSSRIGDGHDTLARGVVSHVNPTAARLGCLPGLSTFAAARMLAAAPCPSCRKTGGRENRSLIRDGRIRIWAIDSASLVESGDEGHIIVTGSHGALLGGRPRSAIKHDVLAAIFNDAGGGPNGRGVSRLSALDQRGILAATASADSARIGDGLSTYETGEVSHANAMARNHGANVGMSVREICQRIVRRAKKEEW